MFHVSVCGQQVLEAVWREAGPLLLPSSRSCSSAASKGGGGALLAPPGDRGLVLRSHGLLLLLLIFVFVRPEQQAVFLGREGRGIGRHLNVFRHRGK